MIFPYTYSPTRKKRVTLPTQPHVISNPQLPEHVCDGKISILLRFFTISGPLGSQRRPTLGRGTVPYYDRLHSPS